MNAMKISEVFGERLRVARARSNRQQQAIAREAGVGYQRLSVWESGCADKVSIAKLVGVADALGVSIDWLLGRESNGQYPKSVVSDRIVHSAHRDSSQEIPE